MKKCSCVVPPAQPETWRQWSVTFLPGITSLPQNQEGKLFMLLPDVIQALRSGYIAPRLWSGVAFQVLATVLPLIQWGNTPSYCFVGPQCEWVQKKIKNNMALLTSDLIWVFPWDMWHVFLAVKGLIRQVMGGAWHRFLLVFYNMEGMIFIDFRVQARSL